ncbi:MAG: hypothetical protein WD988_01700 [Candidatus Curtissbacteria bacterium]
MSDSPQKLPSPPKILVHSVKYYRANWRSLLPFVAIPVIASLISTLIKNPVSLNIIISILGSIIGFLSAIAFLLALKGSKESISKIYVTSLRKILPLAWINFLAALVSLGGYILLIVPGIIISILLNFATFAYIFEDQKGTQALMRSWHLVSGNKLSVFWRLLFFAIASLLFSIPIMMINIPFAISVFQGARPPAPSAFGGIYSTLVYGLLIAPLGTIYAYSIYSYLTQLKPQPVSTQEEAKIRKRIHIFMVLGGIGIVLLISISLFIIAVLVTGFLNLPQAVPSYTPLPAPNSI